MALFGLALAQARLRNLDPARSMAERGLAICREIGDRFFVSYFLWILALVETDAGDVEAAGRYAAEALEVAEELEVPLLLVSALEASARVARACGDDARAVALLTRADDIGRSGMVPLSYVATVVRELGDLARSRGDEAAARALFDRSLSIARSVGDDWGERRTLELTSGA